MEEFERLALDAPHSPWFWKRYIDDTFAIIRSRSLSLFLQRLNYLRPGVICFTHEIQKYSTLSFLDVLVSRTDEVNLSASIYRKPTHTDQLLDSNSHHPVSVKRSVVSTLTNTCNTLPSTIMAKKQEIQHLKKVFIANNYSQQFVHQTMHCSLATHNTSRCETPQAIVSIPYIKGISEHIRRVLAECNIRTFFKTT